MQFIQNNWQEITIAAFLLLRLAESVAMTTESDKDDKIVAKVRDAVKHFFTFGWGNGK